MDIQAAVVVPLAGSARAVTVAATACAATRWTAASEILPHPVFQKKGAGLLRDRL